MHFLKTLEKYSASSYPVLWATSAIDSCRLGLLSKSLAHSIFADSIAADSGVPRSRFASREMWDRLIPRSLLDEGVGLGALPAGGLAHTDHRPRDLPYPMVRFLCSHSHLDPPVNSLERVDTSPSTASVLHASRIHPIQDPTS